MCGCRPHDPGSNPGQGAIILPRSELAAFSLWLKQQGYSDSVAYEYPRILRRLFRWGVNVEDSLAVMDLVNVKLRDKSVGYREKIVDAVNAWLVWKGKPKLCLGFKKSRRVPEVPLEKDLEALISGLPLKYSCLLRLLKETAFRPGEALSLRVKDFDFEKGIVTLNKPEKGGNARQVKISEQLQAQLKTYIAKRGLRFEDKLFNGTVDGLGSRFRKWRKRIAEKLSNPRLLNCLEGLKGAVMDKVFVFYYRGDCRTSKGRWQ